MFGHIVKRNHKTYVEEMRKKFDDRKGDWKKEGDKEGDEGK